MRIEKKAVAGTFESSDAHVTVSPCGEGLDIHIESIVYKQFGDQIREAILQVLSKFDIDEGRVEIRDFGAIDCVLKARTETAVRRSLGQEG